MQGVRTISDTTQWAMKDYPGNHWVFGKPAPRSAGVSQAYWAKSQVSPYGQKGGAWDVLLNGGVQTGGNWAGLFVPVNEMLLTSFTEAQWSYYMTGTETMGVNIVIWAHDPTDLDKRAEISQVGGAAGLAKAAGWDDHTFDTTVTQMFFYGENTAASALTAGTQYTWDQFKADTMFKNWTIYRISLEHGWEAAGTFDPVWLAEVKLNKVKIPFNPSEDDLNAPVFQYHTGNSALATALSPKTPFKLMSVELHVNTAGTQQTFTITKDAGRVATVYDALLLSQTMVGTTDVIKTWDDGLPCMEQDEIDCAWTNTDTRTYGLTYCFKVVS